MSSNGTSPDGKVPSAASISQPAAATAVQITSVSKVFGSGSSGVHALDRVSLDAKVGEFVCLIGASGCGKSTLLNLVAGLDTPTSGDLEVNGRTGLMFQESALFPWLTVAQNIEMALKLSGTPKRERKGRVEQLLASVHLADFGPKRPHELSGGMRQRVALARAFAQDADVLLMDEPFGALDAMTRDLLHDELERLWSDRSFTVLFVTHNVREAARLADRVVLLSSRPGRVAHEFKNDIPRPRRIDDPTVTAMSAEITAKLREEVARHA
ncbi:MAG: ABC transporter ATP-binding protein [Acidimicrobiia bacterium]|nr:ABC transporter ATP-binding protein [Acidimicrobiia bacterium]